MRVLLTTDAVGGVWTFTLELSSALLKAGHSVTLVCIGPRPDASQQANCDMLSRVWKEHFYSEVLSVPLEWMQDNTGSYVDAESSLLRIAHESGAEVLHFNQFCFGAL